MFLYISNFNHALKHMLLLAVEIIPQNTESYKALKYCPVKKNSGGWN
jgi:hypothetical protein